MTVVGALRYFCILQYCHFLLHFLSTMFHEEKLPETLQENLISSLTEVTKYQPKLGCEAKCKPSGKVDHQKAKLFLALEGNWIAKA